MRLNLCSFLAIVSIPLASTVWAADHYEIDPVHSSAIFKIKHLNLSQTYGRFNSIIGSIDFDAKAPGKSSVMVEIATDSVDTADAKRDTHLKSPDFLNTKQFPIMKFVSNSVQPTGRGKYKIVGDLTLHGVTKSISMHAEHIGSGKDLSGGDRLGFHGLFRIKRSDYDMKHSLDSVGDDVEVIIALEGIKK
ncbi:MAG: YceI family protein [Myxococcota bacterium]